MIKRNPNLTSANSRHGLLSANGGRAAYKVPSEPPWATVFYGGEASSMPRLMAPGGAGTGTISMLRICTVPYEHMNQGRRHPSPLLVPVLSMRAFPTTRSLKTNVPLRNSACFCVIPENSDIGVEPHRYRGILLYKYSQQ